MLRNFPTLTRLPALPLETQVSRRVLLLLAASLTLAAWPMLWWDFAISQWLRDGGLPGDLRRLLTWSEAFAHGLGVLLIALAVISFDEARRRFWPRILLTALTAGLLANVIKLLVIRIRPAAYYSEFGPPADISSLATFRGTLPWLDAERWSDYSSHAIQSFPSGHTATAVGFACGLWMVYPKGRWLIVVLALCAGLQRIDAGAHYPSDVLVGASVGLLAAALTTTKARRPSKPNELPCSSSWSP